MSKAYSKNKHGKKYGYARVSEDDQVIAQQITALREYGCDEIFKDIGKSGKRFNRKGLNALLKKLEPGDSFNVVRLDRLGRSVYHLARLKNLFLDKGVAFKSLEQGLDIRTNSGKLMYYIFSAFAEYESDLIGDRTKDGLLERKSMGVRFGRKPLLSDADIIKAAFLLTTQEHSKVDVAKSLKVSTRTLSRSLKRFEAELP